MSSHAIARSTEESLRETIREARSTLKDLTKAIKEAKEAIPGIVSEAVNELVIADVARAGEQIIEAGNKQMGEYTDHILGEFKKLERSLLGTPGRKDLRDLVRRLVEAENAPDPKEAADKALVEAIEKAGGELVIREGRKTVRFWIGEGGHDGNAV